MRLSAPPACVDLVVWALSAFTRNYSHTHTSSQSSVECETQRERKGGAERSINSRQSLQGSAVNDRCHVQRTRLCFLKACWIIRAGLWYVITHWFHVLKRFSSAWKQQMHVHGDNQENTDLYTLYLKRHPSFMVMNMSSQLRGNAATNHSKSSHNTLEIWIFVPVA